MRVPGTNIGARRLGHWSQPVNQRRTIPPPESNPWWWNPRRFQRGWQAPSDFLIKLARVDSEITVCFNKFTQDWGVWIEKPKINTPTCQGWQLLFRAPALDERIFHRLYEASARKWGSAREYWRAVEDEMRYEREKYEKKSTEFAVEKATEIYDYSQIKNIGQGNKFSTYHT